MTTSFKEAGSELLFWQRFLGSLATLLPVNDFSKLRFILCDVDISGAYVRGTGLQRLREDLITDVLEGKNPEPVLVLGLTPFHSAFSWAESRALDAFWQWPGFSYLQYGFSVNDLLAEARSVISGAKSTPPQQLLPDRHELGRRVSLVRHWLQNRRRNVQGAIACFESAALGEESLDSSLLEPVLAISPEHRDMLDRLWVFEPLVRAYAPAIDGVEALKSSVALFEGLWRDLEQMRAQLRAKSEVSMEDYRVVTDAFVAIVASLDNAIETTRECELAINRQVIS